MQLGVSQLILSGESMSDFFGLVRDAGYDAVEVAMRRDGPLTPEAGPEEARRLAELAREHGLALVSMAATHCTGNLLAEGEARDTGIRETRVALEFAAAAGIPTILHTLGRPSAELYYDDAYRNGVAALKTLAQDGERLGVRIAVEFVWSGFLFSPMEMRRFLDDVDSPAVGFYFDPGNMAVFQYPHHWARIVGPRIVAMHAKDWRGRALNGGWTPLLEGEVDFAAVMRELRAAGYTGPLISEVSPSLAGLEDTRAAMARIAAL